MLPIYLFPMAARVGILKRLSLDTSSADEKKKKKTLVLALSLGLRTCARYVMGLQFASTCRLLNQIHIPYINLTLCSLKWCVCRDFERTCFFFLIIIISFPDAMSCKMTSQLAPVPFRKIFTVSIQWDKEVYMIFRKFFSVLVLLLYGHVKKKYIQSIHITQWKIFKIAKVSLAGSWNPFI